MPPPTFPPPTTTHLPQSADFLTSLLSTLSILRAALPQSDSHDPQRNIAHAKGQFLTLHALFPTTLLPALDLLDRRLITRIVLQDSQIPKGASEANALQDAGPAAQEGQQDDEHLPPAHEGESREENAVNPDNGLRNRKGSRRQVYYAQSQQNQSGRYRGAETRSYEVRTQAWSCTCAAFAFAAYNSVSTHDPGYYSGYGDENEEEEEGGGDQDNAAGEDAGTLRVRERDMAERAKWGGLGKQDNEGAPICKHLLACVLAEWWAEAAALVEERVVERGDMGGWGAGLGG